MTPSHKQTRNKSEVDLRNINKKTKEKKISLRKVIKSIVFDDDEPRQIK